MFKLFQSIMGKDSGGSDNIDENSLESLSDSKSNSLSFAEDGESSSQTGELIWQQGNLKEVISFYDREIQANPNSVKAYEQLLSHLHQQNSVAEAYKQLAESLRQQGQNEDAAGCYRQAIVIQAVTNEVEEKYRDLIPVSKMGRVTPVADLTDGAFSFQGSIEQPKLASESSNILQIEISGEYLPQLSSRTEIGQLDSQKTATVEWEAAQTLMQQALDFCDREQWSEVARTCQQATEIMPEMAEAYKIWGNALQRMNRTAEAMECYGKAVEIQPDLAEVYSGIAQLYAQQQKWQPATEYYQRAIIIKPEFARAYRSLAHVWEQCGESEKAQICHLRARELEEARPQIDETTPSPSEIPELPEITEATVNSVGTYHQLARDSEQQNLWHEAAVYYRKALELNLSQTKAFSAGENVEIAEKPLTQNLGQTEPLAPIDDSLRIVPSQPSGQARGQQTSPSLEQAIGAYRKQAKLQPNSSGIQIELGDLYAKKKKWQSALACYSKAIRIDPKEAEAHLRLAKILGKTGNHASYVEHMYLAYTIDPSLGSADDHFLLGKAVKKLGNRNRAIACFEQAIKLQPYFTEAYERLAAVYQEIAKPRQAIACYQAAIRHNPQNAHFYFNLGELFEQQSSWEEGVRAYRQVLELQPKYPQASQKLNNALSKKLQQDLATKYRK